MKLIWVMMNEMRMKGKMRVINDSENNVIKNFLAATLNKV